MAAFLVFILPACWVGMLMKSRQFNLPTQTSNNNEEEREEHDPTEITVRDTQGVRPPVPQAPPPVQQVAIVRIEVPAPRIRPSVTHVPEPSVLSVRRLL